MFAHSRSSGERHWSVEMQRYYHSVPAGQVDVGSGYRVVIPLYPLARWMWALSADDLSPPPSLFFQCQPSCPTCLPPRASWDFFCLPWICSGRLSSVALGLVRRGRDEAETMDRRGCSAQALSEVAFTSLLVLEGLCYPLQVIEHPLFHCSCHGYPG